MRRALIAATLTGLVCQATPVVAQTWTTPRGRPALWQITSIDATGETRWPYGREDVAGDGLDTFDSDEAGSDLRTVYADADADDLFIRAYVAATSAPPEELVAFFFLDIDARDSTGGDAEGMLLWPEWDDDPSDGGFERAVGVRGDGTLIGAFEYDGAQWMELRTTPNQVSVEVDLDTDPIRIGSPQHGYVQVVLRHDVFGLDASCDGNIFVRLWHDALPDRSFGDDDEEEMACRPRVDGFGDPVVLRIDCSADADCPAGGECADGRCVFGYDCGSNADCRSGETCSGGVCVRTPADSCDSASDCDGLLCEDGSCVACTQSGARACPAGAVCAPDGSCRGADGTTPGTLVPGRVRGGAFECAAYTPAPGHGTAGPAFLLWLIAAVHVLRTRRGRR